uniref:Indoleamine 2,3-dioxygenase n=1 Tax=Syphacia muris TaxID=451379 RepID=A0A0N5AGD3_9BILA
MEPKVADLLRSYQIDPEFGFVLPKPLDKLPDKFQPWHDIADNLPELVASGELLKAITNLPQLDTSTLTTNAELRLAHLLLTTLEAAYVWEHGKNNPRLVLPKQLSTPLLHVCRRIGLPPIICHASACLANWKYVTGKTEFKAENIELIAFKFMHHIGNHWFFTLTAELETKFAAAIRAIARACLHLKIFDDTFEQIRLSLNQATTTIRRMQENLPPEVFYHGFRSFLSGYTEGKFVEQGGIILEGNEDIGAQCYNGGSAAQSSTLHIIDGFLDIVHPEHETEFLLTQRNYMPPAHKQFIEWVETQAEQIPAIKQSPEYGETVAKLRNFRNEHIKVVIQYIVQQADPGSKGLGTGGTSFMRLLKNIRNDC